MPLRFQACTAKGRKSDRAHRAQLMTCCLNAPGDGKDCGACPRCKYMVAGVRRCKNTTCMDTDLCAAHYTKRYGVKLGKSAHGTGLFAVRDFQPGELIAPMGGRVVAGKPWEDRWAGERERSSPYGYTIEHPSTMTLKRRQGPRGFVAAADLAPGAAQWRSSRITNQDRQLRRAAVTGDRIYLVAPDDWEAFLADAAPIARRYLKRSLPHAQAAVRDMMGTKLEKWLGKNMDARQFEAYVETSGKRTVTYDAACVRRLGSYANDPVELWDKTKLKGTPRRYNMEAVNARISPAAPFPLARDEGLAWLIAVVPIEVTKVGGRVRPEEILVPYGDKYWAKADIVHKLQEVGASGRDFPEGVGKKHLPKQTRGADGRVVTPRCTLRK